MQKRANRKKKEKRKGEQPLKIASFESDKVYNKFRQKKKCLP